MCALIQKILDERRKCEVVSKGVLESTQCLSKNVAETTIEQQSRLANILCLGEPSVLTYRYRQNLHE